MSTVYPPRQGGTHRAHGLVKSFPESGVRIDRVALGGLATNHGGFDVESTIEIAPDYQEHRPVNPLYDLASIPMGVFGIPNVVLSAWLHAWPPRQLIDLLDSADIVLVELPIHFQGVADLVENTPVVYSSHNVEVDRWQSLRNRPFGKWFHGRLSAIEHRAVMSSAGVVCTSAEDKRTYREQFGADGPIHIAPNATYAKTIVDSPIIDANTAILGNYGVNTDRLIAAFVGSDYAPNVEAANALSEAATRLAERDVPVEILLVGTVSDALDGTPANVTPLGFVDDLDAVLRACDVALNPVTSGGGSNIKMLDYFAAGVPVVSTPFGARGFDVTDGEEVLLREADTFDDALVALQDPTVRESIARAGLAYVRENHVWESVSIDYLDWLSGFVDS